MQVFVPSASFYVDTNDVLKLYYAALAELFVDVAQLIHERSVPHLLTYLQNVLTSPPFPSHVLSNEKRVVPLFAYFVQTLKRNTHFTLLVDDGFCKKFFSDFFASPPGQLSVYGES